MANIAENTDFMEPGEEQLKKLQSKETDMATVIEINELRNDIGTQLSRAEEEGVISRRDVKKWNNILTDSGNSKQAVADIGHQVSAVIEESKRLIGELPSGNKEIDIFRQMSLREKKEYLSNLRKAADDLNGRADKLGELFPDAAEKLKTLRGAERAKYIEDLNTRRSNVAKYDAMMEDHEKHFSKKSQKKYMDEFKELPVSKQEEWLKLFVDTQAGPRKELSERYEKLSPKIRERIDGFYEMSRHDKKKAVDRAEAEQSFADKLYDNPDHKYMSSESRKFMKKTFIEADSRLREAMMGMLDKAIREEADLGRKFEKMPDKVRKMFPGYIEKSFDEKKEVIEKIPGVLTRDYEARLSPWLKDKVISPSTFEIFMVWFKKLDTTGMVEKGTDEEMVKVMEERVALMGQFKELSPEVQMANSDFFNLSHSARDARVKTLKKAEESKEKGDSAGKDVAQNAGAEGGNADAKSKMGMADQKEAEAGSGDKSGVVRAVKESGADLEEAKIREEIKKTKQESSLMKKKIRDKNIAEGLSDLVVTSDLANQNVFDSSKKDTHLQNENERRLNEKFVSFTGGKMVAESGHGKAKNVKEVDLDKIEEGVVTEDVMLDLKKEIVNNQGEKARNVFHVQFADRKSGQKLSGAVGRQKVMEQQRGLHDEITEDVQARMVASGEKMDKAKAEKLRRVVEKDKLKVDLKEAA